MCFPPHPLPWAAQFWVESKNFAHGNYITNTFSILRYSVQLGHGQCSSINISFFTLYWKSSHSFISLNPTTSFPPCAPPFNPFPILSLDSVAFLPPIPSLHSLFTSYQISLLNVLISFFLSPWFLFKPYYFISCHSLNFFHSLPFSLHGPFTSCRFSLPGSFFTQCLI
jgi:hypothetical protein